MRCTCRAGAITSRCSSSLRDVCASPSLSISFAVVLELSCTLHRRVNHIALVCTLFQLCQIYHSFALTTPLCSRLGEAGCLGCSPYLVIVARGPGQGRSTARGWDAGPAPLGCAAEAESAGFFDVQLHPPCAQAHIGSTHTRRPKARTARTHTHTQARTQAHTHTQTLVAAGSAASYSSLTLLPRPSTIAFL